MYLVSLTYHRPMTDIEALLPLHRAWLERYFSADVFIAAGRKDPRTGGVIIVRDIDRARLDNILAEDPFVAVADYTVTKVDLTRVAEAFSALQEA